MSKDDSFWATVEECKKEVASWPVWKQEQAAQWHAQLKRDQKIASEQLRDLIAYVDAGWP